MNDPIRVALVGYGYAGKTFHAPLIAAVEGLQLACVVSSDASKVHADFPAMPVAPTLEDSLSGVDLVVIATPNDMHAPQALAALAAGKHVVVDKPFTLSVAEAEQVIAAAEQAGRLLSVFHNRRWDADFLTLRQLIADGALGEISQFESHYDRYRPNPRVRWREGTGLGAGTWYDLAPHLLDQALCLFGWPDTITADIQCQREGALAPDYFHALLEYRRLRVILHSSCLTADQGLRLAVHGGGGSLVKYGQDPQEDLLKRGEKPGEGDWGRDDGPLRFTHVTAGEPRLRPLTLQLGDHRRFYIALRDAILGKGANPVPPSETLSVMRLIEAGISSAKEGRRIRLT